MHPGVVIQIHSLLNIPDLDLSLNKNDISDAFLTLQVLSGEGKPYGPEQRTTVFDDVHDAIFGECYHTFRAPENLDGAVLRVGALDKDDMHENDKIAHLDIKLADLARADHAPTKTVADPILFKDRVFQTREMVMDTKRRGPIKDKPVSINLRLVPENELASTSLTKRFFLIRHGESQWNEAQDDNNVKGLLKFDHPLNRVGIEQCKKLNASWKDADFDALSSLEKEFVNCPAILCSPLTRCVQTALVSLHSHKTLRTNGMTLARNLREVKSTLGSLDTLGKEVGADNIKNRARDTLLKVCDATVGGPSPPPLTAEEIGARVDPIELHSNDVESKWWTKANKFDKEKNLRSRMNQLMGTLRYVRSDSAILVGHSLFFRAIMRFFLSDQRNLVAEGATREELVAHKIDNAAVVAIDVVFPAFPKEDNFFEISHVSFLFGSGLDKE